MLCCPSSGDSPHREWSWACSLLLPVPKDTCFIPGFAALESAQGTFFPCFSACGYPAPCSVSPSPAGVPPPSGLEAVVGQASPGVGGLSADLGRRCPARGLGSRSPGVLGGRGAPKVITSFRRTTQACFPILADWPPVLARCVWAARVFLSRQRVSPHC